MSRVRLGLHRRTRVPGAVRVDPTATGTRLVLEHRRLTEDERGYGAGWHAHLDRFGDLVAGRDLVSWDERFVAVLPAYRRQLDKLALP